MISVEFPQALVRFFMFFFTVNYSVASFCLLYAHNICLQFREVVTFLRELIFLSLVSGKCFLYQKGLDRHFWGADISNTACAATETSYKQRSRRVNS